MGISSITKKEIENLKEISKNINLNFEDQIIYDFNGNPVSNVNISCGETNTISNKDGFFEIKCDSETAIFLSHIKYKT